MNLVKASKLKILSFDEQIIVFDPNTGQTHCLDSNVNEIFSQLQPNQAITLSQLQQFYIPEDCPSEEKSVLNSYIQDMINNLLRLKLVFAG
ncbi:MAG: hypothetical protein MJK12_15665 [Colwellia sp.]|nr:hypothetical protein [Colwellia sp.]